MYCEDHCEKHEGHSLKVGFVHFGYAGIAEFWNEIYHRPCIRSAGWAVWEDQLMGNRVSHRVLCSALLLSHSIIAWQCHPMSSSVTSAVEPRATQESACCTCGTDGDRGATGQSSLRILLTPGSRECATGDSCTALSLWSYKAVDCLSWDSSVLPHFSSLSPA